MNIKGKITHVLEPVSGESARGKWKKQEYVILEEKDQYPKSIAFEVWNKELDLKVGDIVEASINIESSEYNSKWYTSIKAWKVEILNSGSVHESVPPASDGLESDDLPF